MMVKDPSYLASMSRSTVERLDYESELQLNVLWKKNFQKRIIPLKADLEESQFGLDQQTYESVAEQVDFIYHYGATVNRFPCSKLYQSNVCGTGDIIRLATYTKRPQIPMHYISTVSVLTSDTNNKIFVDKIAPESLSTGYAQSKWVAEKLVMEANRLELPVTIYRLGSTETSTKTCVCNRTDPLIFFFATIMNLHVYPAFGRKNEGITNKEKSTAMETRANRSLYNGNDSV
ncbi:unnamed protein product [Adineta ricciae]|nr:unnamed protein product [Adineta ricciae]